MILITQRNIVQKGIIYLTEQQREFTDFNISFKVGREPISPYYNVKYSTPKGFFGYLQVFYFNQLLRTIVVEFDNSTVFSYSNSNYYVIANINCVIYNLINDLSFRMVEADLITPTAGDFPEKITVERLPFNEFRFINYSNTTAQFLVFGEKTEPSCGAELVWTEPTELPEEVEFEPPVPNPSIPNEDIPSPPYYPPNDFGNTYRPPNIPVPGSVHLYQARTTGGSSVNTQPRTLYIRVPDDESPSYFSLASCQYGNRAYGVTEDAGSVNYLGNNYYYAWCLYPDETVVNLTDLGYVVI